MTPFVWDERTTRRIEQALLDAAYGTAPDMRGGASSTSEGEAGVFDGATGN